MSTATAIAPATAYVERTPAPPAVTQDATIRVHPFRYNPQISVDVPLVRWPDNAGVRERLARIGSPCVLVVGPAERAPTRWTEVEDWVRQSAPPAEFVTRATTVARRADLLARPCFERGNVVTFRGRSVTVPRTQAALVAELVHRFGATVPDSEIRTLCTQGGVSNHGEAVKTALRRLKATLSALGLRLTRVRASGYVLDRRE
jgi:hypothetical protein